MHEPIYTTNYRKNLILYWQQFYPCWQVPAGYHVHHIKPKSTFVNKHDLRIHHPSNLIALHPDDHVAIHKCRGDVQSVNFVRTIKVGEYNHSSATLAKMSSKLKGRISPCGMQDKNHSQKSIDLIRKNHRTCNTVECNRKQSATKQDPLWKNTVGKVANKKISETKLSKEWQLANTTVCPHCCRAITNTGMYKKYHGNNCKFNLPS